MTQVKFDQHFLINADTLQKTISASNINQEDIIYEIGPGKGILTKEILKHSPKQLISIEKDISMLNYLEEIKNKNPKKFIFDINKDGVEEIENYKFNKLIANIPYAITEPLYKKLMDKKIHFIIMLHGIDFYKKIIKYDNNKWHYFVNAFYNIELIKEINGDEFEPKTKTKSTLIKLTLKEENKISKFDEFLQTIYYKKKRNIKNAIIFSIVDVLKLKKKEIKEKLKEIEIDHKTILENIPNSEFTQIIKKIKTIFF